MRTKPMIAALSGQGKIPPHLRQKLLAANERVQPPSATKSDIGAGGRDGSSRVWEVLHSCFRPLQLYSGMRDASVCPCENCSSTEASCWVIRGSIRNGAK
jgi:hypothetical protein